MTRRQIERFLAVLAHELPFAARAYLTGAAAGALYGRVRPSFDIDLGIQLPGRSRSPRSWETVQAAVDRTCSVTNIPANVAEDIDRWGMITLLDYRRSSRLYRHFGRLEVRLLHPLNWSIGKLTRYLDADLGDVIAVFRKQGVAPQMAARIWGRALRASPASTSQFRFRHNVETFFEKHGRLIWGKTFDAAVAIAAFHRASAIPSSPGRS
ncbi:MAG: hypothetical protein QOI66_93 [Myxococcales bacterium]|jgi:hypothetical protein|nr:hypothetical protein [Myxococcales bacterium]